MVTLKSKNQKIILYLLSHQEPVTVAKLAKRFDICERTFRYNTEEIEDFLKEYGLSLDRRAGQGIKIEVPSDVDVRSLANKIALLPVKDTVLDSNEKKSYIISRLLMIDEAITIKEIADEIFVGRNTIGQLLTEVEKWFKKFNIRLIRKTNYGLKLDFTKHCWRNAMISLICGESNSAWYYELIGNDGKIKVVQANQNDSVYIFSNGNEILPEQEMESLYNVIADVEEKKDSCFNEFAYTALIFQLKIVLIRAKQGYKFKINQSHEEMLSSLAEYAIAKKLISEVSKVFRTIIVKEEISYLALQLLSIKRQQEKFSFENNNRKIVYDIVDEVINKTSLIADRQKLAKRVNLNLQYAVRSCITNMYTYNPLMLKLVKQHSKLYGIVKESCETVNKIYPVKLRDDEIAIIASSFIEDGEADYHREPLLRVLVVCMNGTGTARLLSARLKVAFPNIQIVDTLSIIDLNNTKIVNSIDLIISTVKVDIPYPIPMIIVSPLLAEEEVSQISSFINLRYMYSVTRGTKDKLTIDLICEIIDKYIAASYDHQVVRDKLKLVLGLNQNYSEKEQKLMLSTLLTENRIKLHYNTNENDFESVVRESGRLLLEDNCIEQEYIDAMVDSIKNKGSYIVIAKGLALPHARPEQGVLKCGISMVVLDTPVNFGHTANDPVRVVFCLAAVDNSSHLNALKNIATLALNQQYFNSLLTIDTPEEMFKFIESVCQKES